MSVQILTGDCRDVLPTLPSESVHCCITSPPYWGLRDYGTAVWEGGDSNCDHGVCRQGGSRRSQAAQSGHASKANRLDRRECQCGAVRVDRQIGLEETPEEYVETLVGVFREVWRVLRPDGSLWLNLGDCYASAWPCQRINRIGNGSLSNGKRENRAPRGGEGLKEKDLVGIPWMVAFALRSAGWYLRRDIIWFKPNPTPESARDRPSTTHEYLFLLTKQERYFYDWFAVREKGTIPAGTRAAKGSVERSSEPGVNSRPPEYKVYDGWRNKRSVWTIPTKAYAAAHFATFPPALVSPCLQAGTSAHGCCPACGSPWEPIIEKETEFHGNSAKSGRTAEELNSSGKWRNGGKVGNTNLKSGPVLNSRLVGWRPTCECPEADPVPCTVLDPFGGSGTVGEVATGLGRHAILIELSEEYVALAERRNAQGGLFS